MPNKIDQYHNALYSIRNESEIIMSIEDFRDLIDMIKYVSDELLDKVISICEQNNPHYLPSLNTNVSYFDVSYIAPSGSVGTHTALLANDLVDAVIRCPIMLSYGTNYHPREFKVTAVIPTPPENLPQ